MNNLKIIYEMKSKHVNCRIYDVDEGLANINNKIRFWCSMRRLSSLYAVLSLTVIVNYLILLKLVCLLLEHRVYCFL
jgi:hypothetical protein